MDIFTVLIEEICAEEGINLQTLSHGWIRRLTRNGQSRHIVGRHFDINGAAADSIACDKYACATLLAHSAIPTIEHEMLFNPQTRGQWIQSEGEWQRALHFFEQNERRVVVKPNNGWQGRNVFLCETPKALERAIQTIFQTEPNVCLCPYHDITHEFRVFYVNGRSLYVYGKERAQVTGDGLSTLGALAHQAGVSGDSLRLPCDAETIPYKGERVCVSWKHNLSNGASAFELSDPALPPALYALAERAASCINIRFATVDIALLPNQTLAVMEINAGVTVTKLLEQHPNQRETVKKIYKEAILAMFHETEQTG